MSRDVASGRELSPDRLAYSVEEAAGNLILDLTLAEGIDNAPALAAKLKAMIGVVEHGLFIGMTDTCIVAGPDGPLVVGRQSGAAASL